MQRDSMVFYRSFHEATRELPPEIYKEALVALMDYALDGRINEVSAYANMFLQMAKPQVDANNQRYINGSKGGRKPELKSEKGEVQKTKSEPKRNQTGTKSEPNANVNVNDNVLKENTLKGVKEKRFAPPTPENVRGYCREMGYANVDAERFVDFYAAKDWMIGKNRMKDWKAAVRNWARQDHSSVAGKQKKNAFLNFDDRGTDYDAMVAEEARRMIQDSGGGTDEQH